MSDITAVVLTIGEETTQLAIDSIRKQTLPPAEIIIIENVVPFHKALNLGASEVKTEFFVQVDSDMILDENCLGGLRRCMDKEVGIKMFRKECFEKVQFRDSVSPDTDFEDDILKYGWKKVYALKFADKSNKKLWHTFGEHRPSYTTHYTFSKYLLVGKRIAYRKSLGGLIWHLGELKNSDHSSALIAQIAMAHGIFMEEEKDLLKPYSKNEDFDFLERFLASTGGYNINKFGVLPFFIFDPKKAFKKYYKLGVNLRRTYASQAFKYCMDILDKSHDDYFSWIAKAGLCHGLFVEDYCEDRFERGYDMLNDGLLSEYTLTFILKMKLKSLVLLGFAYWKLAREIFATIHLR
jgi:glycosyltransferase involved in cell wall biosynthesis